MTKLILRGFVTSSNSSLSPSHNRKLEKVKWMGEDFERETFESLTNRKATDLEFALNGFIEIKESQ